MLRGRVLATAMIVVTTCALSATAATTGTAAVPRGTAAAPRGTAAAAGAPSDTSLVGEWHLDEVDPNSDGPASTPDSVGSGDYLSVSNPTPVAGRFGSALSFNATNHDKLYTVGTDYQPARVTAMAWVKGSASPGQYKAIVTQGGESTCSLSSYALYTGAGGGVDFYIATGNTASTKTTVNSAAATSASIWDGKWHAVAGTFDGSYVRLYVDGTEVGEPTPTKGAQIDYLTDNTFEVGNYDACQGFDYNGSIDEVRLYNRALSDAEVGEIQSGSATTPPELGADPTTTHVDCMPMTVTVGSTTNCTATVTDSAQAPEAAPTGTVTFSSDSTGTFSPAAPTCTLGSAIGMTSTCSVSYTPTAVGSGLHQLTGAYTSDAADTASTATATLAVTAAGAAAPPTSSAPPAPPATPAPPHAIFTAPPSVSPAMPVTLNAGATTGASTLLWNVNGKPVASCNAATPDLTVRFGVTSAVTLTTFGPGGSSSTKVAVPLAPGTKPIPAQAAALTSTAVCSGGSPTVDVTADGGPPAGCSTNVLAGIVSAVGCLTEVTDPSKVPAREAGILTAMLANYQASPALQAAGKFYCSTIASCSRHLSIPGFLGHGPTVQFFVTQNLYLSTQPVRINGVDFTPLPGASIAVSPGFARVVSSNALVRVGGVPIAFGKINLDLSAQCTPTCTNSTLPIATFDSSSLPGLSGADFPFTGTADIRFVVSGSDRYSEIHGHIQLPASLGGISVDAKLRVDNTNGITPESFHGHADNLTFDTIGLTNVEVDYDAPDNWLFEGDLGIGAAQIRLAPTPSEPFNGVVFKHGSLDHAGATLDLSADPPPIAPGVDLDKVSLSFSTNPSVLRGSVTLTALAVGQVTGNVVLAFPSPGAPFKLSPIDLPNAPQTLTDRSFTNGPVLGVGGAVTVNIPDVGEVPLGGGYLLYDVPGYIAAGGEIDAGIKDVVEITGRVDGEFNAANRRFNLQGSVQGCLFDVCGTVDGVISSYGAGICAGDWGGGFLWSDFPSPHVYGSISAFGISIGKACKPSRFTDDHVFDGHITGVTGPSTFVVSRGKPLPEILLTGDSGAPNVTVTGPHGEVLTADGVGVHEGSGLIAIQSETKAETVIGVTAGTPGTYTITPLPGPSVIGSAHATEPAVTSVSGKVTGKGTRRTLHYAVSGQEAGERITFAEVEHGVSREIGSTTGGKGTINFTTSPGPDQRTIVAQDSVNGAAVAGAQNRFVARFTGPAFVHPGRVAKVSARYAGGALAVSWQRAANASQYRVTLREKHGGTYTLTTRKTSLRIGAADPTLAGVVKVVAISGDGSLGPAVAKSYKAARAAASRFLPFAQLTPKTTVKAKKPVVLRPRLARSE